MYELPRFVENLIIHDSKNPSGNCGQYLWRLTRFTKNMNSMDMWNVQNCVNPMVNCVH